MLAAVAKWLSVVVLTLAVAISGWDAWRRAGPPRYAQWQERSTPSPHAKAALPPSAPPLATADKVAVVTGASGFLGSTLVQQLLKDGWRVTALHRRTSDLTALDQVKAAHVARGGAPNDVVYKVAKLTDRASLEAAIAADTPVVFHVAAYMATWFGADDAMYAANVLGTRTLLDVCLARNVRRFVHTSTMGVYAGAPADLPRIDERTPHFAERSWMGYVNTKALAEREVRDATLDGLWTVILNPAGIVGPYDRTGFARLATMLKKGELPGVGAAAPQMSSAVAIANAHVAAAKKGGVPARNYNLCGKHVPTRDAVRACAAPLNMTAHVDQLRTLPPPLLHALGTAADFASLVTRSEPPITGVIAELMSNSGPPCTAALAVRELAFDDNEDIDAVLRDSVLWLLRSAPKYFE